MEHLVIKPKTKHDEAILNRLLASAEELFHEKDYHATSIYNIIWESLYIDPTLFVDYYSGNYSTQIIKSQENNQMKQNDPEIVSYILMGISNFIGLNWIMFKDKKKFDKVVDEVIEIFDKGLFIYE